MKYLFLTRLPPFRPLLGGEFDYAVKLIEYLGKDSAVHAIAFANSVARIQPLQNVRWTLVPHQSPARWRSIFSRYPNVSFRNISSKYLQQALHAAKDADVVLVDFIAMGWYVKQLVYDMRQWPRRPRVIFVCHNHEWAVRTQMVEREKSLLRIALAFDTFKAGCLENAALKAADGITAITTSDAVAFASITRTPSVVMTPGYDGPTLEQRVLGPGVAPRVTIMANYASQHKRMVVAHALKELCESASACEYSLDVVGNGENDSFALEYPRVKFLGFVQDIGRYLSDVRIGLVPDVIGGGFKTRVLMYAAHRVPILAVESAMSGMGFQPGIDYFSVESLSEMRGVIPRLLNDYVTLNRLQESAYSRTTSEFKWPIKVANLNAFLSTVTTDNART